MIRKETAKIPRITLKRAENVGFFSNADRQTKPEKSQRVEKGDRLVQSGLKKVKLATPFRGSDS